MAYLETFLELSGNFSDFIGVLETSTFVETLRSPSIVPSINDPSTRDNYMSETSTVMINLK